MWHVANRLIANEIRENESPEIKTSEAFYAGEKLRPHLTALTGEGGFRALLLRTLALTYPKFPKLRAVHVNADGSLAGWEELCSQLSPAELFDSRVYLLAELLGLLVAFIGEEITQGLIREIWPNVRLDDSDTDKTKGKK